MLKLAAIFTDHMVLQRERPIAVFGAADAQVTCTLNSANVTAVPSQGRFLLHLPAMPAGGPYTMTVTCGADSVTLNDVMIGEVWLCGGQSNMEFRLHDEKHFAETNRISDPMIRLWETPVAATLEKAEQLEQGKCWTVLQNGAGEWYSAIAVYTALEMRKRFPDVAFGMAVCCLGGTSASSWISRETLESFDAGRRYLKDFEDRVGNKTNEQYREELAAYNQLVDRYNTIAAEAKAQEPDISFEKLTEKAGLYPWPPPDGWEMPRRPHGLWDFMVQRIAPYTARGLYWYQGETDSSHQWAYDYAETFAALIRDWRAGFENEQLPVIAAQLPGYNSDPKGENWGAIRLAQQKTADTMENVWLACLLECGEHENIHPVDKLTPSTRMANLALRHVYGFTEIDSEAVRLVSAQQRGNDLILKLSGPTGESACGCLAMVTEGASIVGCQHSGDEVCLTVDGAVSKVSYGLDNDIQRVMFGRNGLPVMPFCVVPEKGV